jgi:tRNA-intron endonuclease, archaea type
MLKAELDGNKVFVEDTELFDNGWYGKKKGDGTVLNLVEAAFLFERGKIEIAGFSLDEFTAHCANDEGFMTKYTVYRNLRERGLPVRMGFKDCDFRVYERGANSVRAETIKWIVFAEAEDYACKLDKLNKAIKLSKNIRATAIWAIADNDQDVTYYIISSVDP